MKCVISTESVNDLPSWLEPGDVVETPEAVYDVAPDRSLVKRPVVES